MRTLRGRLFAYLAAAVLVTALLTAGIGALLTGRRAASERRAGLERQVAALAAALPPSTRERVFVVRAAARVRRLRPAAERRVLAALPSPPRGSGTVELAGRRRLWAASGTVVALRPAAHQAGDAGPFASSLLLAGALGALVAGALALALGRSLTTPLRELALAARRVAAGERAQVPVRGEDELGELARAFNAMGEDLAAAREAERSFLLSVSHELKTPLTAVRGYAEALADGAVEPRAAAETIGAEAVRLERLVRDLLDLGRLERREFAVAREPVDLAAVVRQAADRFAGRAREAGIELAVEADGPAPATGDGERLLQVVSNLVENALRLVPAGGHVALTARPGELTVRDDGPGLAPEDLDRAFDRFYLYDRYRGVRPVGSGLGLAVVRELTAAMGGSVSVDSAPGRGAAFTVRLPALAPRPRRPARAGRT